MVPFLVAKQNHRRAGIGAVIKMSYNGNNLFLLKR